MSDPDGVHFFLYQDCLIRVPSEDLLPKFGALLLARHLPLREGDTVLDLGTGSGLVGIAAARRDHRSLDHGHVLPPGLPAVCDRLVLCGEKG